LCRPVPAPCGLASRGDPFLAVVAAGLWWPVANIPTCEDLLTGVGVIDERVGIVDVDGLGHAGEASMEFHHSASGRFSKR
jgi:hypothetical protein